MPGKSAAEFYWMPERELYRKRVKDENGGWHDLYAKTKPELREKIKAYEKLVEQAKKAQSDPFCWQYFAQWFKLWEPGKGAQNVLSTRQAINLHILPVIGNLHMMEVTEDDLLKVLNNLTDKSKSLNAKVLRTIKQVFRAARKNGVIAADPAADLTPGGVAAKEKTALTEQQQKILLYSLEDTPIYPFLMVALYSGLRREEALALNWDCVYLDCDHPYLAVRRALRWEHNQPVVSDKLKSDAARRDIPLPLQLTSYLRELKEHSAGDYVIGGEAAWTSTAFRWHWDAIRQRSARVETHEDKTTGKMVEKVFSVGDKVKNHKRFITIGFDVTPHQLRHTYITRLIMAGTNIKLVQYLAGHANVQLTLNIYTHLMEHRPDVTADAVLSAFPSPSITPPETPDETPDEKKSGPK